MARDYLRGKLMETQDVMSISIRPVDPATDLARIAELTNAVHPDTETEDLLREDLARQLDGRFMRSLVASVPGEPVAGYALVDHVPWQPAGRFWVWVTTDQALARPRYRLDAVCAGA